MPSTTVDDSSATPGPSPTPTPSGESSAAPAGAAGCSGSAGNRDFFSAVAESVHWTVYCAVLPDGWFVESGNYRLRSQGQMTIAYRGPGGVHLELREGAFCGDTSGCVPNGQAAGEAQFGDRTGILYELDGGGLGLVVDRGAAISWLAIGGNLDETAFRALAAALHPID